MKRFWLYGTIASALLLLLTACEVPIGIAGKKEMTAILVDVHLTEAAVGQKYSYNDNATKRAYFESVFEKHGITRDDFNASLEWYAQHPRLLTEVYADVVKKIEDKRDAVDNYVYHPEENPVFRHVIDSLNIWTLPQTLQTVGMQHDSLRFELTDTALFGIGEKYVWRFRQRIAKDSTMRADARLKWFIDYDNGMADSIVYRLPDNTATYDYKVRLKSCDTLKIRRIYGFFVVTDNDTLPPVSIDSIRLWRYYNTEKVQIDSTLRARLDSIHGDTIVIKKSGKRPSDIISDDKLRHMPNTLKDLKKGRKIDLNEKNSGK